MRGQRCRSTPITKSVRSIWNPARSTLPAIASPRARLLVFRPGDRITVTAAAPTRLAIVGGEVLDGPRHIWWNFVSSRHERIEQAKNEWKQGLFGKVPGDEIEFIPLPEARA